MATKNTKSVGKILGQSREYWVNAAKQFVWPIDFEHMAINIPQKDLQLAHNDLMVKHFRANGWHVQSCIEVEYTKPFVTPVGTGRPIFPDYAVVIVKEESEATYRINDKFRVISTGCELRITHLEKGKVHFEYANRSKPPLLSSIENLDAVLRRQQWEKF